MIECPHCGPTTLLPSGLEGIWSCMKCGRVDSKTGWLKRVEVTR